MNDDQLFAPTIGERLLAIERFIADERDKREDMLGKHPKSREYWLARFAEAEAAHNHVLALLDSIDMTIDATWRKERS